MRRRRRAAEPRAFTVEQHAEARAYQRRVRRGARWFGFVIAGVALLLPVLADALDLPWKLDDKPWVPWLVLVVLATQAALTVPVVGLQFWQLRRVDRESGLASIEGPELLRRAALDFAISALFAVGTAVPLWWVFRRWDAVWWLEAWSILALAGAAHIATYPWRLARVYGTLPVSAELRQLVGEVATRLETRSPRIVLLDSSRRRDAPNAGVAGLGPFRTLLIFDPLTRCPPDEIDAVLAHEFGHLHRRDMPRRTVVLCGGTIATALGVNLLGTGFPFGSFTFDWLVASPGAYPAFAVLSFFVNTYLTLITVNALGRKSERAADRFAVAHAANPSAYRAAVHRISIANKARLDRPGVIAGLSCTHPSGEARLAAIDEWIAEATAPAS
jgi:STE24 endopeptidase